MAPHLTTFADILRERYDFMSHPKDHMYPEFGDAPPVREAPCAVCDRTQELVPGRNYCCGCGPLVGRMGSVGAARTEQQSKNRRPKPRPGGFLNDKPVDVPGAYSPPKPKGLQWPEEAQPYARRLDRMLSEQVKAGGQDSEYARERVWDRFKVQRQLRKELDRPIPTEERGAGVVALPLDPPLAAYKHRSVRTG